MTFQEEILLEHFWAMDCTLSKFYERFSSLYLQAWKHKSLLKSLVDTSVVKLNLLTLIITLKYKLTGMSIVSFLQYQRLQLICIKDVANTSL